MKISIAIILVLNWTALFAQVPSNEDTSAAITATALDYADGFYAGSPERMERAIHPDLNKVVVVKLSPVAKPSLQYSTYSGLIELTRAKVGFREPEKRNIKVTVLTINNDLASVKLTSPMFNDYLQMVNIEGKWKIVNVLWEPGPETPNLPQRGNINVDNEKKAINATVNDYYKGSFANDVTLIEKSTYPEMRIVQLSKLPQTGKLFISRVGIGMIKEATRAKLRSIPENQQKVDVKILDVMDEMAFAEAITPMSTNYIQLAKMDEQWKIINILNKSNPNTQQQGKK